MSKARSVGDIAAKVYCSENLINWYDASASENGKIDNLNLYKVEMPIPESGKIFFKVEATQN